MPDTIGGTAILDRRNPDGQHLYCLGFRDGKRPQFICIPVYPKGAAKPAANAWEYVVAGDMLNVTPSVRVMTSPETECFHNAGAWSVRFRDCAVDGYKELFEANPEAREAE